MSLPLQNPRLLYLDVINGYSKASLNGVPFYIKHPTSLEEISFEAVYDEEYRRCEAFGLDSEEKKLEYLFSSGEWTESEEKDLKNKRKFLETLQKTKDKCVIKAQIPQIDQSIKKVESEILELYKKRVSLVGQTCETMSSFRRDEYVSFALSFKDKEFKIPLFSREEIEECEDVVFLGLKNETLNDRLKFSDDAIKKIALMPDFFNFFCLGDSNNPASFFKRASIDLTVHQYRLLLFGRRAKNILESIPDSEIPYNAKQDFDSLTDFADVFFGKKGKKSSPNAPTNEKMTPSTLQEMIQKNKKGKVTNKDLF